MTDNQKIMVVMPTYNERPNLALMAEALFGLDIEAMELLVVDDNSPDGTGTLAEDLSPQYDNRIHVLHRQQKAGLGPAYLAGFQHALDMGADLLIQMDADFSHQPHYILEMLRLIDDCDVVVGSRFISGGGVDHNWGAYRRLLSVWANRVYTPAILRIPVYDATGGYRLWRRETLLGMDLPRRIRSNGYVFQVEMIYVAYRLGYRVAETPIYFPDRERGISKMSPRVALEAALRVWQILLRHRQIDPSKRAHTPQKDHPDTAVPV